MKDITGKTVARLTPAWPVGRNTSRGLVWLCFCTCGIMRLVSQNSLSRRTGSCGCLQKDLVRKRATTHGATKSPQWYIWHGAKARAKRANIPFDLDITDIVVTERCPFLNILLKRNLDGTRGSSPSLDRLDSNLGYIKGNVLVMSHKANTMKNNSTLEEFELMAKNWRKFYDAQLAR